jgi:chromosome segregation ATPase
MTPQDLSEARRRAGFESASEIEEKERRRIVEAAEAHITERLDRYLGVLDAIESDLAELERSAPKLTTAAALAKFGRTHQRAHAKLDEAFAELERRGAEGGELHGAAKRVFERWQDLVSGLEPNVAEDPRFEAELKGIREALAELRSSLEALAPGDGVNGSGPAGRTGSTRPDAPR